LNSPATYDYLIAGMGCAGLSLAVQLSQSQVPFQKVLLLDKEIKNTNDRTWCFWQNTKKNWYDPIIFKEWNKFYFATPDFEKTFTIAPYRYCFIRGIDFYEYCLSILKKDSRFEIVQEIIESVDSGKDLVTLKCKNKNYVGKLLFNSAFRSQNIQSKHINYVQHFLGWVIETSLPCFDDSCPTFMDFNTEQDQDFRFFYLIPYSKNKALIEYTGFSSNTLKPEVYMEKIKGYLDKKIPNINYQIIETEQGSIPMAESEFVNPYGKLVVNIGTAGGYSKPSTGYTFYFIQKFTAQLVSQLNAGHFPPTSPSRSKRFLFYDKILLEVLHQKKQAGRKIFETLFKKNKISVLLDFLNEESSLGEELKIMNSVNKRVFVPVAIKKILNEFSIR